MKSKKQLESLKKNDSNLYDSVELNTKMKMLFGGGAGDYTITYKVTENPNGGGNGGLSIDPIRDPKKKSI